MKKIKIEVTAKIRRKLAAKFDKSESTIYSWIGEMEEGADKGTVKKCRDLAVALGGKVWITDEQPE
ncbi:MAG: hypothetical protein IJT61_03985 [Bacteroidales bacterium]|nr:hypothetical protein [Bacteroidales bacterium]